VPHAEASAKIISLNVSGTHQVKQITEHWNIQNNPGEISTHRGLSHKYLFICWFICWYYCLFLTIIYRYTSFL